MYWIFFSFYFEHLEFVGIRCTYEKKNRGDSTETLLYEQ